MLFCPITGISHFKFLETNKFTVYKYVFILNFLQPFLKERLKEKRVPCHLMEPVAKITFVD